MNNNVQVNGGIGFFGLLTIVFIVLKLTGYITWSWLWVLGPLWIPTVIVLAVFAFIFLGAVLFAAVNDKLEKK